MPSQELQKCIPHITVETINYVANSVVMTTIIKRPTRNTSAVSFDSGEMLSDHTSPFDTFIQIIDGQAQVVIDEQTFNLSIGESVVIPANTRNIIKANVRFKDISTIIKSVYEDVS